MRQKRFSRSGFTLPFVAMVAFGLAILVYSVAESIKVNAHHMTYFNNMSKVFRLAQTGTTITLGKISTAPDPLSVNGYSQSIPGEGDFQSFVTQVSSPSAGTYYVVTWATRTAGGKMYTSKLHTYASVASIGDYFAMFQNEYVLSPGMNATGGKIYAPNVTFYVDFSVPARTEVADVEYVHVIQAQNQQSLSQSWAPADWATQPIGTPITPNEIFIGTSAVSAMPKQLSKVKRFPVIASTDLDRYENYSGGSHHVIYQISGEIGPPGFHDYLSNPIAGDTYAGHCNNNQHHVYFSTGDLTIGAANVTTRIHGEVMFVARGNIRILGSIINDTSSVYPGAGQPSSSTVHYAVFATPQNIQLEAAAQASVVAGSTISLHGLLFAPNGTLYVLPRTTVLNPPLCFQFLGSQVVAGTAAPPQNLPTQFGGARTYNYNMDFRRKPPNLPPQIGIYYSFEENLGSASVF